jgi:hypothetical protein
MSARETISDLEAKVRWWESEYDWHRLHSDLTVIIRTQVELQGAQIRLLEAKVEQPQAAIEKTLAGRKE